MSPILSHILSQTKGKRTWKESKLVIRSASKRSSTMSGGQALPAKITKIAKKTNKEGRGGQHSALQNDLKDVPHKLQSISDILHLRQQELAKFTDSLEEAIGEFQELVSANPGRTWAFYRIHIGKAVRKLEADNAAIWPRRNVKN